MVGSEAPFSLSRRPHLLLLRHKSANAITSDTTIKMYVDVGKARRPSYRRQTLKWISMDKVKVCIIVRNIPITIMQNMYISNHSRETKILLPVPDFSMSVIYDINVKKKLSF